MMTPLQKLAFGKIQQICFVFFWGRKSFFCYYLENTKGWRRKVYAIMPFYSTPYEKNGSYEIHLRKSVLL